MSVLQTTTLRSVTQQSSCRGYIGKASDWKYTVSGLNLGGGCVIFPTFLVKFFLISFLISNTEYNFMAVDKTIHVLQRRMAAVKNFTSSILCLRGRVG
jgi:hypothetical protein